MALLFIKHCQEGALLWAITEYHPMETLTTRSHWNRAILK